MSVSSGQLISVVLTTRSFNTGQAVNADVLPKGDLVINGVSSTNQVLVTNITIGRYSMTVTLPTLITGQIVQMIATTTIQGITNSTVVWFDSAR